MRRSWVASLVLLAACSGDRRVPYGQDDRATDETSPTPTTFEPLQGRPLPPETREVAIEGVRLVANGDIRAVLPVDLDDDGDRDAVVVTVTEQTLGVSHALRETDRFTLQSTATLPLEGCTLESATLSAPGPEHIVAEAEVRCEDAPGWRALWLLTREARPRILETLSRRGGTFALRFEDVDEDGHGDVVATTSIGEDTLELRFLDRPSGLARERNQPAELLERVRGEDRSRGARLAAALCTGDGAALRVGTGAWGLDCPEAFRRQAAASVVVTALEAGDLLTAVAAIEGEPSELVVEALNAAARPHVRMERIAPFRGSPDPATAHVALRFEGEDLVIRGAVAERYGPGGQGTPADASSAPVTDPSGRLFVQGLVRTCAAVEASLVGAAQLGPGVGFATGRRIPVFREAIEGCTEDSDDSSWRVLGWAPQGLVVARPAPSPRIVVPLTADGLPAGDPVVLRDDDPPPAPLRGGRSTPSGDTWILETPHGVIRTTPAGSELWRPADWAGEAPRAAALSEDGTRIAVLRGDAVFLLRAGEANAH